MNRVISVLYFYIFICLLLSCTHHITDSHSYGTQVRPAQTQTDLVQQEDQLSTNWINLFGHSMQAVTQGFGGNLQVKIQNLSDSFLDEPLFIVNDISMGKGFMNISAIDANNVERIRILNRPNQIANYGQQGRHGVILIKTTKCVIE